MFCDSYPHLYVVYAGAQAIAAGSEHSLMLKTDGTVWATGDCDTHSDVITTKENFLFVEVSSGQ